MAATTPYQQVIPQIVQPQQYQQILPQPTQQQQFNLPTVGVFWVQGLEGAKGYQVNTANTEVYLRDSEDNDILYVKTTDQFGRPNSLKMYRLNEETIQDATIQNTSNFVTVDQLNDILDEKLDKLAAKFNKPQQNHNGKRNNGSRRNRRYEEDEDYDETE